LAYLFSVKEDLTWIDEGVDKSENCECPKWEFGQGWKRREETESSESVSLTEVGKKKSSYQAEVVMKGKKDPFIYIELED